jgi:hypothetical protein
MVNKLANAIEKEHNTSFEVGEKIAKHIQSSYTTINEEDIPYFLDNLKIFDSIHDAAAYEIHEKSFYSLESSITNIINGKEVDKNTLLKTWLKEQDYHNLDIENNDIWFTIYE